MVTKINQYYWSAKVGAVAEPIIPVSCHTVVDTPTNVISTNDGNKILNKEFEFWSENTGATV